MWTKLLLWAILLGSIIMGYMGYQTGSATNAIIGIIIFIIAGFFLFFFIKAFIHFGFMLVKIILFGAFIGIIVLGALKGCQLLLLPSKDSKPEVVSPKPPEEPTIQSFAPDSSQTGILGKAKNFFSFSKKADGDPAPIQNSAASSAKRPSLPTTLNGKANNIRSGSLFKIGNHFVKLYGIDTPDPQQICWDKYGAEYDCGQKSKMMLSRLIADKQVSCQIAGGDYKKNYIATCKLQSTDIGASMVTAGWAVADRKVTSVYIPYEEEAHRNDRGLWAGKFVAPWKARNQRTKQAVQVPEEQGFFESLF